MERRSYRSEVYDDLFRVEVISVAWVTSVVYASKKYSVSVGSIYRWEKEISIPLNVKISIGKSKL